MGAVQSDGVLEKCHLVPHSGLTGGEAEAQEDWGELLKATHPLAAEPT